MNPPTLRTFLHDESTCKWPKRGRYLYGEWCHETLKGETLLLQRGGIPSTKT